VPAGQCQGFHVAKKTGVGITVNSWAVFAFFDLKQNVQRKDRLRGYMPAYFFSFWRKCNDTK